ncbi:MAG: hypothetical protein V4718_17060 [Pseudomonadota bacterium]
MYFASGHSTDMAGAVPGAGLRSSQRPRQSKLPKIATLALASALVFFLTSWLLPAELSQIALDLMSWCLVGALAAGTLFASVKVLENVLDL